MKMGGSPEAERGGRGVRLLLADAFCLQGPGRWRCSYPGPRRVQTPERSRGSNVACTITPGGSGQRELCHLTWETVSFQVTRFFISNDCPLPWRHGLSAVRSGTDRPDAVEEPGSVFKTVLVCELGRDRGKALDALGRAMQAGYSRSEVDNESELADLRSDPRYRYVVRIIPAER